MSYGYTLRWFHEDDLDTYIDGLNESLYDRYDRERFQWKFSENPFSFGFTSIVVAVDDDSGKPVGFNSFLPLEIRIGDTFVPIVQGCDGYVDKKHRRRGIFMSTIKYMEQELPHAGSTLLMGFNFEGSTAAAVKAGSTAVCDINYWEIKPEALRGRAKHRGALSVQEIDITEAYRLYSDWSKSEDQFHIHRSLAYMRWRFEKSPLRDYRIYSLNEGNQKLGYVVLSVAENDEGETIVGLDDYILSVSNPRLVTDAMVDLLKIEEDAVKLELLTKEGGVLDNSLNHLNIEPELRYSMILKQLVGLSSEEDASENLTIAPLSETWHITTSDIF